MRALLTVVLSFVLAVPHGAYAGQAGILAGRVLPSADARQIAKTIWVGSIPAAVAPDGTFRAAGIPEGPAQLAIETSEGLYVVANPVTIAPGATRLVQLAFAGRQDSNAPPPPETRTKRRRGVWGNPLSATLIIVGSAIVLGVAVDQLTKSDKKTTASPTSPTN